MFSNEQKTALQNPLNSSHVKRNPKGFDYVEGWHVINEANRIFGFDGWDRETTEMQLLHPPEQDEKKNWRVAYRATARVKVRAGTQTIIREGTGYGSGILKDIRDAHESAMKEAETDAMKRAFMTFGYQFGLALYDKDKSNVVDGDEEERKKVAAAYYTSAIKTIRALSKTKTIEDMRQWWADEKPNREAAFISRQQAAEIALEIKHAFEEPPSDKSEAA